MGLYIYITEWIKGVEQHSKANKKADSRRTGFSIDHVVAA